MKKKYEPLAIEVNLCVGDVMIGSDPFNSDAYDNKINLGGGGS